MWIFACFEIANSFKELLRQTFSIVVSLEGYELYFVMENFSSKLIQSIPICLNSFQSVGNVLAFAHMGRSLSELFSS